MRRPRRNPDFRQRRPEAGSVIPTILSVGQPSYSGGSTLFACVLLSRLAKVNADAPSAEVQRAILHGYRLGVYVQVQCAEVIPGPETTDGLTFQLRFAELLDLSSGYRLDIPSDWGVLSMASGSFLTGLLNAPVQIGTFPRGALSTSGDLNTAPRLSPLMTINGISMSGLNDVEISFDTFASGDLILNGVWPVIASMAGAPTAMVLSTSQSVLLSYAVGLTPGETLIAQPYQPEILSVNGYWAPPVYYTLS